ncbi:MAG: prepilin peptidase [Corynebacterium sp.]|uniref:prepilin peptidase n=1 Tax=Corynebacterium sp. TaxID=1720 RepID=UPI0026E0DA4F|nr:prepilin peptidase [Corynebacterium sp.]MDO5670328.1 prepilin peptidase [Corynebacterium sp.]
MLGGALIVLVVWCVAVVLCDERHRRIPDSLTLPALVGAVIGALLSQPAVLLGGLAWAGLYLLGYGIGGGDVKLAAPLGIVAAAAGGVPGVVLAIGIAGLLTVGRGLLHQGPVPHGPSMLVGTITATLMGVMS